MDSHRYGKRQICKLGLMNTEGVEQQKVCGTWEGWRHILEFGALAYQPNVQKRAPSLRVEEENK